MQNIIPSRMGLIARETSKFIGASKRGPCRGFCEIGRTISCYMLGAMPVLIPSLKLAGPEAV